MTTELALFPLNQVLFPGGGVPLRVFELRYRRLLDECGRTQPFGLVRIRYGLANFQHGRERDDLPCRQT